MRSSIRSWMPLIISSIIVILFLVYRYGFKDRFYNFYSKSTELDLTQSKNAILLSKHDEQGEIEFVELNLRGKLSDNITLYISKDGVNSQSSMRIKQGKIDTSFRFSWEQDQLYLLVDNPENSKSKLELEYQFVTK